MGLTHLNCVVMHNLVWNSWGFTPKFSLTRFIHTCLLHIGDQTHIVGLWIPIGITTKSAFRGGVRDGTQSITFLQDRHDPMVLSLCLIVHIFMLPKTLPVLPVCAMETLSGISNVYVPS